MKTSTETYKKGRSPIRFCPPPISHKQPNTSPTERTVQPTNNTIILVLDKMKINTLFFVATLASCTQALQLAYKATGLGPQGTDTFEASLWVYDVHLNTSRYRGSSIWRTVGIHKFQLRNAEMGSFEFCIDVFGDIDCEKVWTGSPKCVWGPTIGKNVCTAQWEDDNWGSK
ncbi:MAG: hypothetical protein J3R72DRAFT_454492 [Linnemannia gamsii]|nr:MAG: hypothetical protein J3R72DRAFT_454492 [Linnemannia gamsii]